MILTKCYILQSAIKIQISCGCALERLESCDTKGSMNGPIVRNALEILSPVVLKVL